MTTQVVAQTTQQKIQGREGIFAARLPALAGLLAAPGFLQLVVSNGLSHSFGQRMQGIAVAWLVLEMTGGSKFWLGLVNGLPAVSIVLFSLIGGVVADQRDARKVLVLSRVALASTAFVTAVVVVGGQAHLALLLAYVLIIVGIAAVDMPVSRKLLHDTVGSQRILGASASQSVFMNVINIAAPVVMGVLIGLAGPGAAFGVLAAGYTFATILMLRMRTPQVEQAPRRTNPLADIRAGIAYMRRTPTVAALVGLGFLVPVAGIYFAMVPVYAREVLQVSAAGLGVLVASFSVGSLVGSLYLAVNGSIRHRGVVLTVMGTGFGVGMVAFAVSDSFILSCAISFGMGITAGFWQNMVTAMVQVVTAPEMRGRVLGVASMGLQLIGLGWLLGGLLASVFGVEATVAGGGVVFTALSLAVFARSKEMREID